MFVAELLLVYAANSLITLAAACRRCPTQPFLSSVSPLHLRLLSHFGGNVMCLSGWDGMGWDGCSNSQPEDIIIGRTKQANKQPASIIDTYVWHVQAGLHYWYDYTNPSACLFSEDPIVYKCSQNQVLPG
jgi:hypothetical protein